MRAVIFTPDIGGHNLEYIHHIYEIAIKDVKNTYIFCLPNSFNDIKHNFVWDNADNVRIDLISKCDIHKSKIPVVNQLRYSYKICKLISYKQKQYKADFIFNNTLITFTPFAPLLINKNVKICGIIYRIYLYDKRSVIGQLMDIFKYKIMSKSRLFYKVFILNDSDGAFQLNKLYKTDKFVSLPDPFVPIFIENPIDVRSNYKIAKDKILFIHFGALNRNKGTLNLLESVKELSLEERNKYAFFLAGKVEEDVHDRFYSLLNEIKETTIIVKDEFCSYEFLGSLCEACDAIVLPYKRIAQSSGLIGYAAQFCKPVIAPSKGLLGNLVKKYQLGITIEDVTSRYLIDAYALIKKGEIPVPESQYCEKNCVGEFKRVIYETFLLMSNEN